MGIHSHRIDARRYAPLVLVSLVLALPAAADTITVSGQSFEQPLVFHTVGYNAGAFSLIAAAFRVSPNGANLDSVTDNFLAGTWALVCCSLEVQLPAGSTINSATFTFSDAQAQPISASPDFYSVTGSLDLNDVQVAINDLSGDCGFAFNDFAAPFSSGMTYPLNVPCASSTDLLLFPDFSGTGFVAGTVLQYPTYDPARANYPGEIEYVEFDGFMDLTMDYSATVDFTPLPEPNETVPFALAAAVFLLAGAARRQRETA